MDERRRGSGYRTLPYTRSSMSTKQAVTGAARSWRHVSAVALSQKGMTRMDTRLIPPGPKAHRQKGVW